MIKRFNPDFSLSISHELDYMRETPEGGYVAHGDYATLFSELELVKADRDAQQKLADALAVENVEMREAIKFATAPDMWIEQHDGMLDYRYSEWYVDVLNATIETPATDAALAAIEVRGVEKFAAWASEQESMASGAGDKKEARIYCQIEARAKHFAIWLREAK